MMEEIIKIIIICILIYIVIVDIKKKIISDVGIVILIILGIYLAFSKDLIIIFYFGISLFMLPGIILYSLEDYFKRELIGFGDVKLLGVIGGLFSNKILDNNIKTLFQIFIEYYRDLYIFSGIFAILILILNRNKYKNMYLPFAPFIILIYFFKGLF